MTRMLPLLLAVVGLAGSPVRAEDWYQWRGPEQDGVSHENDLPDHWAPNPKAPDSNLMWKAPYGGRSTPIVMKDRVFFVDSVGEQLTGQERLLCFAAKTGKVLWERRLNVFHTDIDILRVGWTNLVGDPETGNIYFHGTQGFFQCYDRDGKLLWSHSLTEEYGRISGYGGRNSSPVIDGDLVILGILNASWGEQAGPGNRWLALDKRTGTPVWWSASPTRPKDTYASCPVIAVINGERLLITGGGDGAVHALRVCTGELVWSYMLSSDGLSSSPVVDGSLVYMCHGGGNLDTSQEGRIVCLDGSKVKEHKPALVWSKAGIKIRYSSPLLHAGRLYVCDESARLHCFDAASGKKLWTHKYGRNAKASPVWADGKIYVGDVNARFHILKPGDKDCKELDVHFFPSPDGVSDVEINGNAAVADGRVYFATSYEFFCIGKKEHAPEAAHEAALPEEEAAAADARPAHLQVVPVDVSLAPGQSANFKVRAFDAHGHFLRELEAKWSLAPMELPPTVKASPPALKGEISEEGKLTVDKRLPAQAGGVVAEALGLSARARVRVAPLLPYNQDFEKVPVGATPMGWVNTQGKFVVVEREGSRVLKKLANNASPLFARANAYIGMPYLTNYTIQADMLGVRKGQDLSDMGLVANRYTMILDGNKQRLSIFSWESTPTPRVEKTIAWSWKPDAWYQMKLSVALDGEVARIHGKVWQRGQPEPAEWTIECEDPAPNREGSPALYSYVSGILEQEAGAEVFFDNVRITPHSKEQAPRPKRFGE